MVEGLVAIGQANLTVLIEAVIVGDGVAAGGLDEHAFVGFPVSVSGRQGGQLSGLDRGATGLAVDSGAATDLGEVVVLHDGALDGHAVADLDVGGGPLRVHEDTVRGVRGLLRGATGSRGLDVDAVESAGRIGSGDDAHRGDGLVDQWAGRAIALDRGNRGLGRVRDGSRGGRRRRGGCRGRTRMRRGGTADLEVRRVVVGVDAMTTLDRGGVRRSGSRLLLGHRGSTVTNQVNGGPRCVSDTYRTLGGTHECRALGVGSREGLAAAVSPGLLDQEVATSLDDAGQAAGVGHLALASEVFQLPPLDGDVRGGGVEQFDEVVGPSGTGVTATSIDLIDDDVAGCCRIGMGRLDRDDSGGAARQSREACQDASGHCGHEKSHLVAGNVRAPPCHGRYDGRNGCHRQFTEFSPIIA